MKSKNFIFVIVVIVASFLQWTVAHKCIHDELNSDISYSFTSYHNHPFDVIKRIGENEFFRLNEKYAVKGGNYLNWMSVLNFDEAPPVEQSTNGAKLSKVYTTNDNGIKYDTGSNTIDSKSFYKFHSGKLSELKELNELNEAQVDTTWKKMRVKFDTSKVTNSDVVTAIENIQNFLNSTFYLYPVKGNLLFERTCANYWTINGKSYDPVRCVSYFAPTCGTYGDVPTQYLKTQPIYSNTSPNNIIGYTEGGSGSPDTDLIIYVTNKDNSQGASCGTGTIAYAATCSRDQFDRPISGYINVCMTGVDNLMKVMLHEIFHVLGLSSSHFIRYRRPNGSYYANPVIDSYERDTYVKKLNIQPALDKAKEHFGCSSLNGIELENQGGSGTAQSHLERRIFDSELMIGELSTFPVISQISLAVLESSNWYRVDYKNAERFAFGYQEGCNFAYLKKCITGNPPESTSPKHYCLNSSDRKCTVDRKGKGDCYYTTYTNNIDSEFRYFSDPKAGGRTTMDYCPSYHNAISSCSTASTTTRGEKFGSTSKCLDGTLSSTGSAQAEGPACYELACTTSSGVVTQITVTALNSQQAICGQNDKGATKSITGYAGTIICPDNYEIACETSPYSSYTVDETGCVFQCRNGGQCIQGICNCTAGYSGTICEGSSATTLVISFFILLVTIFTTIILM